MTGTSTHWETRLFSGGPSATSGADRWTAQVTDGMDDPPAVAGGRVTRVSARAAYQEVLYGRGLLVDIRSAAQRNAEGEVAAHLGLHVVERNALEWRFDPRHEGRYAVATFNHRVIVLCQEGHVSPSAVETLLRLGIRRATDVVGGFRAWREAGLPWTLP